MANMQTNKTDVISRSIKPEIKSLVRIKDTFDDRFDHLRLDKKERLIPFNEELFAQFKASITFEDISGYAELGPLYRKLADYIGVNADQLLLTAGSDLAIKSVFESCMVQGDNIVLHSPGYAMFRVYADMYGVEKRVVSVNEDWTTNFDAMLEQVDGNTKMVAIENPNGFVGVAPDARDIERMAEYLNERGVIFLIDEAYYYVEHKQSQSHRLIEKYENVLITQTFSKAHGLAGLRVGYLIGDANLMDYISRIRPMHEITSLSAKAMEWVLDHPQLLDENQKAIQAGKEYMMAELAKMNIEVRNTSANFLMVHLPEVDEKGGLAQLFREKGILIRRPFEEPFMKGWSLVCIGSLDAAKQFIKTLKVALP